MKRLVKVVFPSSSPYRKVETWWLTTEHSQSFFNLPVLVDRNNQAHRPGDLPKGTVIRMPSKDIILAEGAKRAGYTVEH